MNASSRGELLIRYAQGPALLHTALAKCPQDGLEYRPGPGTWSIQDIVLHLAESEVHGYLRGRTIIAEPGSAVCAYDQDLWAQSLDLSAQPLSEAVDLFRLLREIMARQLRALPEAAWDRFMVHPERGQVTLAAWLESYVGHLDTHLAQMERTCKAFAEHR
jgi:hypothetical protein